MPSTVLAKAPSCLVEAAKYLAAATLAFAAAILTVGLQLDAAGETSSTVVDARLMLDLAVGILAFAPLPFRHRFPFVVAVSISVFLVVSGTALGAWTLAVISLAKHRRVLPSLSVLVLASAATMGYEWWMPQPPGSDTTPWWALLLFVVVCNAFVTGVGFYLGIRADLLTSLRERAETAEREQASRAAGARTAERSRIAREMHDVLAHRISTVAMHSGALAYRTDLPPQEVQDTARLIQENAHSALIELRDILGVLRDDARVPQGQGTPEPPQPTLSDVDGLVADARATGQQVELTLLVDPADVPAGLGRHLYRSVQECLTNARKHAPGTPVVIRIDRRPGDGGLTLEVSNLIGGGNTDTSADSDTVGARELRPPTSGLGLLGLAERADLAGGRLDHGPEGDRYVTRLTVPWPERRPA